MLICPSCKHQQETGKFCGLCGTAVEPLAVVEDDRLEESVNREEPPQVNVRQTEQANEPVQNETQSQSRQGIDSAATVEIQEQQTTEVIKEELSNYWSYFLNVLKNPTRAFQSKENHFVNSLVTVGLYALLFSLSIYFLGNSLLKTFGRSILDESLPFFPIVSRLLFFILIMFIITFGSAFAMTKLAKNQESFKLIMAQYGSILVPFTALNLLAFLGGIIGSVQLTMFSLAISVLFAFSYVPALFVYEKVSNLHPYGQKIYFSLGTILLIGFISFLLGDAILVELIGHIEEILYYDWF